MSKKRKSDASRLDEVERSMYTTFCSAANSLSQLYSQAMNHQRLSFQAGERHALEKLFQWILRQQEEGSRVTTADIVAYLQNGLEYGAEECQHQHPQTVTFQHQHPQTVTQVNSLSAPFSTNPISPAAMVQGARSGDYQAKNSVFSNALSSPVRRSLQHFHSAQGGYHSNNVLSSANGPRKNENNHTHQQNREPNSPSANDCMDMHADSPGHDFHF
ncbi:PREDICTED: uncharacterized protein LOC18611710 isoform X1 [Theobroma cacao]|uniref:Uncharacterized protein LOC18611710 isoform X1 n=2 Tax=Theobroma cacao TaxID=3641 RepID=A0AB32VKA8_THECC|nr:PREDICTED: uncharacterized protein LOC18611710 isoform X1 [Theobroma cacao]EOX92329.1 Uncharacterized protein TCM_001288 [Theobroma cacao]